MRIARLTFALMLVLLSLRCSAQSSPGPSSPNQPSPNEPARWQSTVVTGKLLRTMAIGAESTGWTIELDPTIEVEGKPIASLQVLATSKPERLSKYENKFVRISGGIGFRNGVETGRVPVLRVHSIRTADAGSAALAVTPTASPALLGSEWRLVDLGGRPIVPGSEATLTFPEAGRVAGNGSCNRFFGSAEITGDHLKLGPLASSRMACPEPLMLQETTYLKALENAERFQREGFQLLLYARGFAKPISFKQAIRMNTPVP